MNKKDIIFEIQHLAVSHIRQADVNKALNHNNNAETHATIANELIGLLATINKVSFTTQYDNTYHIYNFWKLK